MCIRDRCSLLILYLPGLGLLYLFIKDLPTQKLTGLTYGFKDFGIIFLAQNAVIIVIAVITLIEAKVSKKELKKIDEDTIYDSTLDVALLLLAIPLLEEFVTRDVYKRQDQEDETGIGFTSDQSSGRL